MFVSWLLIKIVLNFKIFFRHLVSNISFFLGHAVFEFRFADLTNHKQNEIRLEIASWQSKAKTIKIRTRGQYFPKRKHVDGEVAIDSSFEIAKLTIQKECTSKSWTCTWCKFPPTWIHGFAHDAKSNQHKLGYAHDAKANQHECMVLHRSKLLIQINWWIRTWCKTKRKLNSWCCTWCKSQPKCG